VFIPVKYGLTSVLLDDLYSDISSATSIVSTIEILVFTHKGHEGAFIVIF